MNWFWFEELQPIAQRAWHSFVKNTKGKALPTFSKWSIWDLWDQWFSTKSWSCDILALGGWKLIRDWMTEKELRMLSRSLSECQTSIFNVVVTVSQFVRNSQLCLLIAPNVLVYLLVMPGFLVPQNNCQKGQVCLRQLCRGLKTLKSKRQLMSDKVTAKNITETEIVIIICQGCKQFLVWFII